MEWSSLVNLQTLFGETEETSLHFWGECPALELESTQLRIPGKGRPRPIHHQILNLFEPEKIIRLMEKNSSWLEVSNLDDPPSQTGDEDGGIPPYSKQRCVQLA